MIGPWSDTFHTPLGRRRPFMLVALGPIGFCLALMAFMPSLWTTALLVFAFFFAYYVYEPPYRGLYPDLLPERLYGRAQSVQHLMRGLALGTALIGGGALFHVWEPFPFLVAAVVVVAACAAPIVLLREDGGHGRVFEGVRAYLSHSWRVFRREPEVRPLPDREHGVGGNVRRRADVRRPLHHGRPRRVARTTTAVLAAVAGGYVVAARRLGLPRRPVRPQPRDRRRLVRLRRSGSSLGGFGERVARAGTCRSIFVVSIAGGTRDDARLGPALQADARRRPGRDRRARDDDEGRSAS